MGTFQAAMPHKDCFNSLHKAYLIGRAKGNGLPGKEMGA